MKIRKRAIKKPRVEMLPLIDSVFLILVFFIYAFLSMTVHRGVPVSLPTAISAQINKQDYLSITITEHDEMYLNKELKRIGDLRERLITAYTENTDLRVYINGDKNARHGLVVKVLDCVRVAGIEKVSIETQSEGVENE